MKNSIRRPQSRRLGAVATTAAFCLALSACGGSASGGADNGLQKIMSAGTLQVGSCLATPPWGIINAEGKPDGFDVDVAKQLGEYLKVQVVDTDVSAAGRVPSLQSAKLDLISCTFTVTDERKQQIDFSDPVVATGNSLVALKSSSISKVEDLKGKTVAVNKGGSAIGVATAAAPEAILQPYESFADALLAVKQGQADSMIDTSDAMGAAVKADPSLKLAVDGEVGPKKYFALGIKKGQPELTNKINEFLKEFHSKNAGTALYQKWFKSDPTYQFQGLEGK